MDKKASLFYINSVATVVVATLFLLFPIFFLTTTTDFFALPKQILVITAALVLFILWGARSVAEGKVSLLLNPLNLPVLAIGAIVLTSAIFSPSRLDALLQAVPFALAALMFFGIVNFIQDKQSFNVVLTSLIVGAGISSLLTILSYFKIYVLPMTQTQNQFFNTFGSPIQFIAFLTPLLILCVASVTTIIKNKNINALAKQYSELFQLAAAGVFGGAIALIFYQIITSPQKPILLPLAHGFRIAMASITPDPQRSLLSFLLGSGYGTFSTDFTRFILPAFNASPYWNLTFSFSSSYFFELIATTGIAGLIAFLFIIINFLRSKTSLTNPLFLSVIATFVLTVILPFSFSMVFLLFALLSLYITHLNIAGDRRTSNVSLNLVAFNQGLFSVSEESGRRKAENYTLPVLVLIISVLTTLFIAFFLVGNAGNSRKGYAQLINSDLKFAKSFSAEALKSGSQTYNLQTQAITEYPYRSDYYRIFSQVNLALASSLVATQQGNSSPSAQVQQNILGLLQQSINSARQAVTLSPMVSLNWQNLGQIYRNLIGVGQNAEQFAIASLNQAITLAPVNPALRIELGGIYYQLQQWDLAQNQFLIASQLKPDYANAYYNLGKTFEQKNDLNGAIQQFQIVKQLVAKDPENLKKINEEIAIIEAKIGEAAKAAEGNREPTEDKTPLEVNKPDTDFPDQDPRVKIPEPPLDEKATKSAE